jgi:hypothetical protein
MFLGSGTCHPQSFTPAKPLVPIQSDYQWSDSGAESGSRHCTELRNFVVACEIPTLIRWIRFRRCDSCKCTLRSMIEQIRSLTCNAFDKGSGEDRNYGLLQARDKVVIAFAPEMSSISAPARIVAGFF